VRGGCRGAAGKEEWGGCRVRRAWWRAGAGLAHTIYISEEEEERGLVVDLKRHILFIGIRTLFDRVTRGYGDHSPLTRPKEIAHIYIVDWN
jgi:hypothetical protein